MIGLIEIDARFGGLLATGLYQIGDRGHESGWRWIFIIEGILTSIVGILCIFILPSTVDRASFLTPEERRVASARLIADKPLGIDATGNTIIMSESFEWRHVIRAVFSLKTWLSALAYFAILTALYSFGLFIPTIVQGLGYTAVRAQLFSVPPYAVAAVLTVVAAYLSDRLPSRGPIILCFLPLSIAGYAILRTTTHNHVKYGSLFLIASGLYPSVPPVLVWISNNYTNHYTRATAIGLQLAIANCGGFPAAFVYKSTESPIYREAHTIVMGMLIGAWILVAVKCAYLWYINREKDRGRYEEFRGCGDDRDPEFKYII